MISNTPASHISREIKADVSDLTALHDLAGFEDFDEQAYAARLKLYLKQRFNLLLQSGKRLMDFGLYQELDIPTALTLLEQRELDLHANQLVNGNSEVVTSVIDGIPADLRASPSGDRTAALIQTCKMLSQLFGELSYTQADAEFGFTQPNGSPPVPLDIFSVLANAKQLASVKSFLTPLADAEQARLDQEYMVSTLYERFKKEKAGSIDAKTVDHYDIAMSFLREKFGDIDIRNLDKKMAVRIKQAVMDRRGRRGENLSAKRTNAFLSNYRTFFSWYLAHSDEDKVNPFSSLDVEENRNTQRFKRRVFQPTELAKILCYEFSDKREAKAMRTAARWFPAIAYYTGMRLNEIAELTPERIRLHDSIWVVDLTELKLKNENAERLIPLHDALLDMGIVDFAKRQANAGHTRLFHELSDGKDGFGEAVSKWFNRTLLKKVGIDKDAEMNNGVTVDFHCFRKTAINTLVETGGQMHQIKALVGHSNEDDVTIRHYTMTHVGLPILRDLINQIPWI